MSLKCPQSQRVELEIARMDQTKGLISVFDATSDLQLKIVLLLWESMAFISDSTLKVKYCPISLSSE